MFVLLSILVSMTDGNWNFSLKSEFFNRILKCSAGKKSSDKIVCFLHMEILDS